MRPLSYMRSVVDRNVVMRRMTVLPPSRAGHLLRLHISMLSMVTEYSETSVKQHSFTQCQHPIRIRLQQLPIMTV